ncbi:hypothetical protein [Clostridium sp. UBA871]|uniref:hypothetical protein n=1 Tax=Clostridium sp. UBA871 TaxID=1946380 RepID=UPI0032168D9A
MNVQITDCTIRDGGYLLNKNSEPEFVKGVISGLVSAGIDFIETGFLQNKVNEETIVYHNSKDIVKYLPEDCKNSNYMGFCDNSRYSVDNLDEYDGKSFKWLRISFAKHEIDSSLEFCQAAMKKGYLVQFNPMDSISYSFEEREELINKVNTIKPDAFSIVDTFGAMYLDDLTKIFRQVDVLLDKDIKIGLHSHDNLGLSCALAEHMVMLAEETDRDIIIDGSLFGMGRGAGNASTELLADYLNKKCGKNYNIPALLETIDKYIAPMRCDIHWGYDLPMYICGSEHSHVDNVYYLRDHCNCSTREMYEVISALTPSQRTRYGANYSKTDFTDLQKIYDGLKLEVKE